MSFKTNLLTTTVVSLLAGASLAISAQAAPGEIELADAVSVASELPDAQTDGGGSCNPCAAKACNPCNPCAAKACNPCNPCAAKACNPCNPCAAKAKNPCGGGSCNPCAAKACNPCNPCAAKACNPCNPCAAKACNPCNPCAAKACNPCNPCAAKAKNPCGGGSCNPDARAAIGKNPSALALPDDILDRTGPVMQSIRIRAVPGLDTRFDGRVSANDRSLEMVLPHRFKF